MNVSRLTSLQHWRIPFALIIVGLLFIVVGDGLMHVDSSGILYEAKLLIPMGTGLLFLGSATALIKILAALTRVLSLWWARVRARAP